MRGSSPLATTLDQRDSRFGQVEGREGREGAGRGCSYGRRRSEYDRRDQGDRENEKKEAATHKVSPFFG